MHLTGEKGLGIEIGAVVSKEMKQPEKIFWGWFFYTDNETFQTCRNWDLDRESCLENVVSNVIWLPFHHFLGVAYDKFWMTGLLEI